MVRALPVIWEASNQTWKLTDREYELKELNDGGVEEIVRREPIRDERVSDGLQQVTLDDVPVVEVVF